MEDLVVVLRVTTILFKDHLWLSVCSVSTVNYKNPFNLLKGPGKFLYPIRYLLNMAYVLNDLRTGSFSSGLIYGLYQLAS